VSKAEELKKLRKLKGLTQKECAELICVNIRTYRRWESGESNPPTSALMVFYGIEPISSDQPQQAKPDPEASHQS
jgi:transcriptional regulator with XRE-family HTH domain